MPNEITLSLSRDDIDRVRQWFDCVEDVNQRYLEGADYDLARRIYQALGRREPSSITEAIRRQATHGPWVEWRGGKCPVPGYERPELRYRSGGSTEMEATRVRWTHTGEWNDVLAYRVRLPERNWQ